MVASESALQVLSRSVTSVGEFRRNAKVGSARSGKWMEMVVLDAC